MALHAEFRFGVRLFREPDAGNPPVRFDEREEETELSQTGLRRRGESPANCHREATVTAPLLDSTQILTGQANHGPGHCGSFKYRLCTKATTLPLSECCVSRRRAAYHIASSDTSRIVSVHA